MTAPAFTVQGHPVTAEQRDAGLAAMRGRFARGMVAGALLDAGVPFSVTYRAADRLLQSERRAGRIRVVKGRGCWEVVS